MADIIFRKVRDRDFEEIKVMYHAYIDWQATVPGRPPNPKISAEDMVEVYHKRKRGSQAENYWSDEQRQIASDHYGWVGVEDKVVIAYFEWGGKISEGECGCYISVWKEGREDVADDLLAHTFKELKELGFTLATGHMSNRMLSASKNQWIKKYANRIIKQVDGRQFQRDL